MILNQYLRRPPDAFRPFTGAEWRTISGFSQPYDVCLDWPKPVKRPPRVPDVTLPASVPILIVGGNLDSLTPLADAPSFGPRLGANVEIVTLRSTVHVTSEYDTARRAATVAAQAFADATIRRVYSEGANRGPGLRGGAFTASGDTIKLRGVRFVSDVTVDGTGTFRAGAADATATIGDAMLALSAP